MVCLTTLLMGVWGMAAAFANSFPLLLIFRFLQGCCVTVGDCSPTNLRDLASSTGSSLPSQPPIPFMQSLLRFGNYSVTSSGRSSVSSGFSAIAPCVLSPCGAMTGRHSSSPLPRLQSSWESSWQCTRRPFTTIRQLPARELCLSRCKEEDERGRAVDSAGNAKYQLKRRPITLQKCP